MIEIDHGAFMALREEGARFWWRDHDTMRFALTAGFGAQSGFSRRTEVCLREHRVRRHADPDRRVAPTDTLKLVGKLSLNIPC